MTQLTQLLVQGISTGAIYGLVALGLVLSYKATEVALTTDKLVKALQASTFKGVHSYDTQRFANNHIDPEWTRVEQVVQGRWTARSNAVNPAKIAL